MRRELQLVRPARGVLTVQIPEGFSDFFRVHDALGIETRLDLFERGKQLRAKELRILVAADQTVSSLMFSQATRTMSLAVLGDTQREEVTLRREVPHLPSG